MTLEIRVYKEITAAEPKVMWGMSWRQLAAATMMGCLSAGIWLLFWKMLGLPDLGQYVVFLADLPIAAWGWLRPKGLKPETYLKYVIAHRFGQSRYFLDGPARHDPPKTRRGRKRIDEHDPATGGRGFRKRRRHDRKGR